MLLWERGGNRSKKQCWEQEASTNIHIHTGIPYSSRLSIPSGMFEAWSFLTISYYTMSCSSKVAIAKVLHQMPSMLVSSFQQSVGSKFRRASLDSAGQHEVLRKKLQLHQTCPLAYGGLTALEGLDKFLVMSHQMPWECTCLNHIEASVLHREQGVCIPSVCLGSSQMRALCNICNKILTQPVTPHSDSTVL